MSNAPILERLARALADADAPRSPYPHWLMRDVLPDEVADGVRTLPFEPPPPGDTLGRRETHNATRVFFSPENRARFPVMEAVAAAFQTGEAVRLLEAACDKRLAGAHLRIEYCQDREGFWLEPHTDIAVKRFTMLVYLSTGPDADNWGTDVYDADMKLVGRAPGGFNRGLIFIPAGDTWHGFAPRSIAGVRRSIIINYVGDEWRARDELAYPDSPVA